jgi:hypothetical protein
VYKQERIVAMQDDLERIIEVSRIGERIGKYKQAYARFGSFGIPQEEFLKALSAFEQLINLIEKGVAVEQLYQIDETDITKNSEDT